MKQNYFESFLALLRTGLWETNVQLQHFGKVEYEEVMRLAEEQSVVGLVTAGMEHAQDVKVPQEWVLQFIGQSLQIEQQNQAMNSFISGLIEKSAQSRYIFYTGERARGGPMLRKAFVEGAGRCGLAVE